MTLIVCRKKLFWKIFFLLVDPFLRGLSNLFVCWFLSKLQSKVIMRYFRCTSSSVIRASYVCFFYSSGQLLFCDSNLYLEFLNLECPELVKMTPNWGPTPFSIFLAKPQMQNVFFTHSGEVIAFIEIPGSSILYLNAEISNICVTVEQEDC